jgi:hypothetical protein
VGLVCLVAAQCYAILRELAPLHREPKLNREQPCYFPPFTHRHVSAPSSSRRHHCLSAWRGLSHPSVTFDFGLGSLIVCSLDFVRQPQKFHSRNEQGVECSLYHKLFILLSCYKSNRCKFEARTPNLNGELCCIWIF